METINDKLTYLTDTKAAIKQAIIAKGVSVSDSDTFRSYADKIGSIETGGGIAGAPSGIKFSTSTFTTVPSELFPYLEQQADLSGIFRNCENLTTVPLFNTIKAIYMNNMFKYCKKLQTLPQFDTANVNNMGYMFHNCTSLTTVPLFDTANVNNMGSMFYNCTSLTTLPLFNTANVNDMSSMFYYCTSLTTVPLFNTANVNDMGSMFYNCTSLTSVPLFNTANVNDIYSMFYNCTSLTNLGGFTGLKVSLDLRYSSLLTIDSVMNVIANAADMTTSPKTLALSKNVFNKLSQEQIATATAKGWNIASK